MSRINAVRIVNLNYNNSTMKVNDEIFEMGGESTLLSLRNGGGKSVMVQMIMAPFVNAKYRDLKDRKFENYFKSNTPTYILTEWILDNNSGYVLIGMCIKKRNISSDEEARDELEIITFTHEYKMGNKYDIHRFPVTEKTDKGFRVKNFSSIRNTMDEIKNNRDYIFQYFELNIDSQRRKYFEYLKQYGINHREWESIIKKINIKESGLSELFQEAKTISGLVEKWFLPTVSDKLNDRDNKIKNFRDIIKKFIFQYKDNENRIVRKQGIEEFRGFSQGILDAAEDFRAVMANTEEIKNDIGNLYFYISNQIEKLLQRKTAMEEELLRLRDELDEVEYERLSLEYHGLNDNIIKMKEEKRGLEDLKEDLNNNLKYNRREISILECAKLYDGYRNLSKQLQTYEYKLDLARNRDSENISERNNIGFTLRKMYEEIVEEKKAASITMTEEIKVKEGNIKKLKNTIGEMNRESNRLNREFGALESAIVSYNDREVKFNTRYIRVLKRNIIGEYDEVCINSYKNEFEKTVDKTKKFLKENKIELEEIKNNIRKVKSEQEDSKLREAQLNMELEDKKESLEKLKVQIEEVKKILLYSNIEDTKLYDREYVLKQIIRRIGLLREDRSHLIKELDRWEKERKMYQTGRNIRLSEDIRERLAALDINLVFGLEWLKKQSLTVERKRELINNNPFLPYSLIMTNSNLEKLKREDGGVFTSFPIPIIEQERLDDGYEIKVLNNIYTIGNINFFISFNDRILNEEKLKAILIEIEGKIENLNEQIVRKDNEIEEYTRHKQRIEGFNVKKSDINLLEKNIGELEGEIKAVNEKISLLIDNAGGLEINLDKIENAIKEMEKQGEALNLEREDFRELMAYYERYKNENKNLAEMKNSLKKLEEEREMNQKKLGEETECFDRLKEQFRDISDKLAASYRSFALYRGFNEGEYIKKDIEDLEAQYEALNSKLGAKVRELEEFLANTRNNFYRVEGDLLAKAEEDMLSEDDYRDVAYDSVKLKGLKEKRSEMEKESQENGKKLQILEIGITRKENEADNKLGDIKKLNREMPKDKIYITNLDFNTRKEMKNREINACIEKRNSCSESIESLGRTRDRMEEYANFKITMKKDFNFPYNKIEGVRNDLIKSYHKSIEEEKSKEKILSNCCTDLSTEVRFTSDEFFKNTIDILLEIRSNPEDVIKTLETVNEVHKKMLKQLETDLERIEAEKKNIMDMLYEYIQQIHEHIGRIDDNSSININGKPIKMLEIFQPKWEEKEEYYRLQIKDFLESITQKCLEELFQGRNIEDTISKDVTTISLYDSVVGIGEIDIKLYKVEASKQVRISWNQVSENSGGEGFLSAFVILTSLLSYMRKEENDIFNSSQEGKVIIMDNPFAQTNAEHLLKPLMEIAKKNNTQLICFTGLGGDSIYNRFENIYVLNLIESKLRQGMQYIEMEHKKGQELTHLTSSRFKIQEEKVEQMMLF